MNPRTLTVLALLVAFGCTAGEPPALGIHQDRLTPCPDSPNCVSSDADDERHHVAAFVLRPPLAESWAEVRAALDAVPRLRIVDEAGDYLRAESRSRVFRFIDDLELHFREGEGIIAVRSASRLGRGDLGVNRRRVERLRSLLASRGLVEAQ